jgi:hypothetical protein
MLYLCPVVSGWIALHEGSNLDLHSLSCYNPHSVGGLWLWLNDDPLEDTERNSRHSVK